MNIPIIRYADRILGSIAVLLLVLLKPLKRKSSYKNVCFIQLWGVGETLLTLPAIDAFRKKYPDSKITVLCTPRVKEVYTGHPAINNLIPIDISPISILSHIVRNFQKYDLVIDFEEYLNTSTIIGFLTGKTLASYSNSLRSILSNKTTPYNDQQHTVQTHLDLVRLFNATQDYESLLPPFISDEDSLHAQKLSETFPDKKLIGIAVGVGPTSRSRMWPLKRFAKLADELIENHNAAIILTGTYADVDDINKVMHLMKHDAINLAGKTNLKQTFALMQHFDLFIGNDSGPMHMAASMGTKTLGLFGPNIPTRWAPYGKQNKSIYDGRICKYSPCINVHKGDVPECLLKDNVCMKNISLEHVLKTVQQMLNAN